MIKRSYLNDVRSLSEILAVCAIACAKVEDLGIVTTKARAITVGEVRSLRRSHVYHDAAHDLIPKFLGELRGLEWMRVLGLMVLYEFQVNNNVLLHHYLGQYCAVMTIDGLDDMNSWGRENAIDIIQREEGKRLVSYSPQVMDMADHSTVLVYLHCRGTGVCFTG